MLWKITINWFGENRKFYSHASNEQQALNNGLRQLSKQTGVNLTTVRAKVLNGLACYQTKEVKEND